VIAYLQEHECSIPIQYQPALVLGYAERRELNLIDIMPDTLQGPCDKVQYLQHKLAHDERISPGHYLQLLKNLIRALDSADTSFMLGQQMLPGHYGEVSHALLQAPNLRQALQILVRYQSKLCPLLQPRFREEAGIAILYWSDSFGAPSLLPFLVEMHMTAVTSMCRWLSGERLAWRFCFNRSSPRHNEQHRLHLGADLRFNCQLDAMLINATCLDHPWPRGNAMASALILENLEQQALLAPALPSLLGAMYDYLLRNIRTAPNLETCAQDFGISPATMKRHLTRHGTHFQAELDQVRTHVALHLFQSLGYDNEAVASYLGFHDSNNFRRSFKRWTGQTPSLMRDALLAGTMNFN
jgi:AraC-like DNA-binding protein